MYERGQTPPFGKFVTPIRAITSHLVFIQVIMMEDSADMGVEDYGEPQPGTVVFLKSGAVSIL